MDAQNIKEMTKKELRLYIKELTEKIDECENKYLQLDALYDDCTEKLNTSHNNNENLRMENKTLIQLKNNYIEDVACLEDNLKEKNEELEETYKIIKQQEIQLKKIWKIVNK